HRRLLLGRPRADHGAVHPGADRGAGRVPHRALRAPAPLHGRGALPRAQHRAARLDRPRHRPRPDHRGGWEAVAAGGVHVGAQPGRVRRRLLPPRDQGQGHAGRRPRPARYARPANDPRNGAVTIPTTIPKTIPTYDELLARTDAPAGSAWGLWGADDQLGTLNLLTPDRVVRAAGLVRTGRRFNLDHPVNAFEPYPSGTRRPAQHHTFANNPYHRDDWVDSFYMQSSSQIDSLRH